MKLHNLVLLSTLVLTAVGVFAKGPTRSWRTGTVTDVSSQVAEFRGQLTSERSQMSEWIYTIVGQEGTYTAGEYDYGLRSFQPLTKTLGSHLMYATHQDRILYVEMSKKPHERTLSIKKFIPKITVR